MSVFVSLLAFAFTDLSMTGCTAALGYSGVADPSALPLLLFFFAVFGLIWAPLLNGASRVYERQCDRYALDHTHNKDAYRSAFIKLARINKADPDPHPLVALLFYDHPPIRERLAMAEGD